MSKRESNKLWHVLSEKESSVRAELGAKEKKTWTKSIC